MSSYGRAGGSNKCLNKSKGGSKDGSRGGPKGGPKRAHNDYHSPKEWNALSADDKEKVRLKQQQSSGNDKVGSSASCGVRSVDTDSDNNILRRPPTQN